LFFFFFFSTSSAIEAAAACGGIPAGDSRRKGGASPFLDAVASSLSSAAASAAPAALEVLDVPNVGRARVGRGVWPGLVPSGPVLLERTKFLMGSDSNPTSSPSPCPPSPYSSSCSSPCPHPLVDPLLTLPCNASAAAVSPAVASSSACSSNLRCLSASFLRSPISRAISWSSLLKRNTAAPDLLLIFPFPFALFLSSVFFLLEGDKNLANERRPQLLLPPPLPPPPPPLVGLLPSLPLSSCNSADKLCCRLLRLLLAGVLLGRFGDSVTGTKEGEEEEGE
jgi:hypothetical protein